MLLLEFWHIIILALLFGVCSIISMRKGQKIGAENTIISLIQRRVIDITERGEAIPYNANNENVIRKL
jgi:hypothetical protein